jgi:uncharacterized SAM-binding protein YcdF (DUF218 family)
MSPNWILTNAAAALLLPPMSFVMLALCGLLVARRFRRQGIAIMLLALAFLLVLSTGAGSRWLAGPVEQRSLPVLPVAGSGAQAIVILGGGRLHAAPGEQGRDIPGPQTLLRLRHGAQLQRQTGLPVLVSGGSPADTGQSEAAIMARSLREDFGVPVRWLEEQSENTAQNASMAAQILRQAGITRVALVTDAIHMPRAQAIFIRSGLEVVAAPAAFVSQKKWSIGDGIPTAAALKVSHDVLHERLGLLWYALWHGSGM